VTESLIFEGRKFRLISDAQGEVGTDTEFDFHDEGDYVWASYRGGTVRAGWLIGIVSGASFKFRYVHLNLEGETSSGRSMDQIEVLDDGRMRLHENWAWESREGAGRSVLEEVRVGEAS
jgi:hypothetical protein